MQENLRAEQSGRETQDSVSQEPEGSDSQRGRQATARVRLHPGQGAQHTEPGHQRAQTATGGTRARDSGYTGRPGVSSASQQAQFRVGEEQENTKLNKYLVAFFKERNTKKNQ